MISIPYLPFEIIEHINDYLMQRERYELMQLNRTFYQVFIRFLYRNITIESKDQYKQLVNIFKETQYTNMPLGQCVHQLDILLDELSENELIHIQQLCLFVQSIHIDWRIWNYLGYCLEEPLYTPRNYHPRRNLPAFATKFLSNYGSCRLSSLTLDLYNINRVNSLDILCYTPRLRSLTLLGLNQPDSNININVIESIHQACPFLEQISLEGYRADALGFIGTMAIMSSNTTIKPLRRMKSFKLQSQYGTDRYQDWLPYLGQKYPNLLSLDFHHSGSSKNIVESCPVELYRQFITRCPKLTYICWNNTVPDFRFFQELDKAQNHQLKRLEVYDNIAVSTLLTSALFDSQYHMLSHVTQLVFGPMPRDTSPQVLIQSIAEACPLLSHLKLCEPHCNLATPFRIDTILDHCQRLVSLELDHVALRVSFDRRQIMRKQTKHPLQSLTMRHCSSFDGVFDHVSSTCPHLDQLSLFACTQRDRRYKVRIHMPHQKFRKVQLHGLRTETFDVERRIRFFSIVQQQKTAWYYMNQFQVPGQDLASRNYAYHFLEMAVQFATLSKSEVAQLCSLLEKPMPWSFVELCKQAYLAIQNSGVVPDWEPKDIYDAGYVDLVCQSIDQLYINKQRVDL
jgi:hypothetical protein